MAKYYEENLGYNIVGGMNTDLYYNSYSPRVLVYNGKSIGNFGENVATGGAVLNPTSSILYVFKDAEGNPLTFDMGNGYMVHADCVYVDPILYPDLSVIDRCAMMHDSGEQTEKMLEMWSRVKGDNLSPWMLGFIILSFTVIVVWIVWRKVDAYRKQQKMLKRHHHARKQQK